jgi:hypothetical protein
LILLENLKKQYLSNKKYIHFSIFRYVEFGILALLFFLIAKRVDPEAYGQAARSFIIISYSSFVVLGINQVLVKFYPVVEEHEQKFHVLYNFFYNLLFTIIVFLGIRLVIEEEYAIYVSVIGSFKLIIESCVAIHRVKENAALINLIYLSNAIPFAIFFFTINPDQIKTFFQIWSSTISFATIIGLISIGENLIVIKSNIKDFFFFIKENYRNLLKVGVQLVLIGMLSPVLGSLDKLILSFVDFDKALLGNMQLADNIANVASLGVGSVLFIITPKFISKIHSGELSAKDFYKKGIKYFFIIEVAFASLILMSYPFIDIIFSEYTRIFYPLVVYFLTRITISSLFMYNVIIIAKSKEIKYLQLVTEVIIIYSVLLIIMVSSFSGVKLYYITPVVGFLSILYLQIRSYLQLKHSEYLTVVGNESNLSI